MLGALTTSEKLMAELLDTEKDSNLANISNITYYLHYTNDFGPQQCFYKTRNELNSAMMKVKGTDIWIEINVIVNGCTPIEKVTVTQELTKNQ